MGQRLVDLIERRATGRAVAIGWAVFFGYALVVFPLFDRLNGMPTEVRPLDLRFAYTADTVRTVIGSLGDEGRTAYLRSLLIADVAWPLIYGTVLALTIAWGFRGLQDRRRHALVLLPVATVLLDALENASVALQLVLWPTFVSALAWTSSVVTSVKWVAATAATLTALAALVAGWRHRGAAAPPPAG